MDGQKQNWQAQLKKFWGGLQPLQRVALAGTGVLVLALALYAILWAQTPDYATLFSGLSEQDAAAVVEQLKELKIPYRILQGGTVIQVPQRQVYDARLEMARQGLPKGGTVGFELFDSGQLGNLGMTDFMQRVNFQRALEGELARTIAELEPVAGARVHLVLPQPSLFLAEQREPTASVVLQLKPMAELSREQIRAINHLVASSVEGLKPGNITLVDVQGNVLSAAGEEDTVPSTLQASTGQIEVQRAYERDLETRLQTMLDQALGPNHAVVRVSAWFNWDRKEINSETYAPLGDGTGVVRSEQTQEETYEGNGTAPGGIPGVDSNSAIPTYPAQQGTGTSRYSKRNTTRNYELSKVVQTVTQAPGTLQRLSVAVLLDEKLAKGQADRIQAMVATAAGLDTSRGDTISVQTMPFEEQLAASRDATAEAERRATIFSLARLGALVLALLILLRFAQLTFRELSLRLTGEYMPRVSIVETELPEPAPAAPQQLPQPGQTAAATPSTPSLEASQEPSEAFELPEEPPVVQLRRRLTSMAERSPELIAELVQAWLAEAS
jgi:flagellar M-ring protein FliF